MNQAEPTKKQKGGVSKIVNDGQSKEGHERSDENEHHSGAARKNSLQSATTEESTHESKIDIATAETSAMCATCGGTSCFWAQMGSEVVHKVESMRAGELDGTVKEIHAVLRKSVYRIYTYERHGFLGKGKRIKVSDCVAVGIRQKWPDPNENYMRYRSD